ncbi:LiaI-LiaF-like domain-containing protein [Symbiobacterium thermophilum]|uniref:LiaI-LiaF-like domain-containing protein n=1 Tax=Symbiobacterium thermophilum TaxID=2734 RepID=UPI0035C69B96
MDQQNPRRDQRPELDREPSATPEPTTPPSPVPPVPAYRPPLTSPFRTSAIGEGGQPEPTGTEKTADDRPDTGRMHGRGEDGEAAPRRRAEGEESGAETGAPGRDHAIPGGAESMHSDAGGPPPGTPGGRGPAAFARDEGGRDEEGTSGPRGPHGPLYHPPPPPPRSRRQSIVGPLVLIFLGLFFLGQSLGLIEWSLWEVVWRLWPVWLIVAGLDMLFGQRGGWVRALLVLIAVAIVLGIVLGIQPQRAIDRPTGAVPSSPSRTFLMEPSERVPAAPSLPVTGQQPEPVTIAQPLEGISAAEVRIESAVSVLELRGGDLPDLLIEGTVVPLIGEQVQWDYDAVDGTGVFRLYSDKPTRISSGPRQGEWDLVLTDRIPISLHLSTGVADSDIDLTRLHVPELNVEASVGEVSIKLPETGAVKGTINAGIGEVILWIPEGRPARIRVETGIGSTSVAPGFLYRDGYYVTPQYADQEDAVDLVVTGGVGTVDLRIMD